MKIPIYPPSSLIEQLPLSPKQVEFISQAQNTCKNIHSQKDQRLAIILGPCSIHNYESAIEYAHKLKNLSKLVEDSLYLIMRVYVEKPRTTLGWKGLLYDPYLDGSCDISQGIALSRRLLLDLADMNIPTATEFVNPITANYLRDLISWGFIGARTSSSQIHRELVSSLNIPIGFKNNTEGNLQLAIDGALAANAKQSFLGTDNQGQISQIQSNGNPFTHIVLRGSDKGTNFDAKSIEYTAMLQNTCDLHSKIIIDCAHGNSSKNPTIQEKVFQTVVQLIKNGNPHILGLMLESFLKRGNQTFHLGGDTVAKDISITDPCIDWETTKSLILWSHKQINSTQSLPVLL